MKALGPKLKEKRGSRKKKFTRMQESRVATTAGPKPEIRAVSATAAKKKKNGKCLPTTGAKFAASAAETKHSARPYRSAGFSRFKSIAASRWRNPSICDHSSVTRAAGRARARTLTTD